MVAEKDEGLIGSSPAGGPEAFESVIIEHQRMIHALCFRMTGSLADAEDLAQETFITAHRQLHTFKGHSKLSSWLYRIAMNLCLNWRKRSLRLERLQHQWAEEQGLQGTATAPSEPTEHTQQVQQALLSLDAKQRAAIVLTVYDGLSHGEAALVLNCSETTVSWRIFVARRKLKKLLENLWKKEVEA